MTIDFLDLSASYNYLKAELDEAVLRVLASGRYILGEEVEKFETEWAQYCGSKFAIGVGNGLDALFLALKASDIGEGDEVLVPSFTFIATWLAVSRTGAKPVPIDCDYRTFNINGTLIEKAITPRTRAIIPVHLFGQPADLREISKIADKYSLEVIEDAAQAHGAEYHGLKIGGHGNTACWSFYPGKNLGAAGDGGAITLNCEVMYKKLKNISNYGSDSKYHHTHQGINSRLDEMQASVLTVKLKYLDLMNLRRRKIAGYYLDHLKDASFTLPHVAENRIPVWHQFVIKCRDRSYWAQKLKSFGVPTLVHYPVSPHKQPAYADKEFCDTSLPMAEQLQDEVLSLPIDPMLAESQYSEIVDSILSEPSVKMSGSARNRRGGNQKNVN